jgi:hypothetical protein
MASTASILALLRPTPNSPAHLALIPQVSQALTRFKTNVFIALQALTALVAIMLQSLVLQVISVQWEHNLQLSSHAPSLLCYRQLEQAHTPSAEVALPVYYVSKAQAILSIVLLVKIVQQPHGFLITARVVHTHPPGFVLLALLVSTVLLAPHTVSSVHQVPTELRLAPNQFLTVFKQQLTIQCPLTVKQLPPLTTQCTLVMSIHKVLLLAIQFPALLARSATLIL